MKTEKLNEYLQWDVKSWSKALLLWEKNIDWTKVETALELGGNKGGLSLYLAQKGIKTICSDYENIEEKAKPLHEKYHLNHLINYQNIDATNIPYENHFDIIVFKSIIGGIGRNNKKELQIKVFQEIHKALKPGGKLLFAENLVASPFHAFFRKKFTNWGNSWRYLSQEEMKEFLQHFHHHEIHLNGFLATFGRNESQRNFLARIDQLFFDKICPNSWKYIAYGIAEKKK
jgi:SAM-dependent methyltransferase